MQHSVYNALWAKHRTGNQPFVTNVKLASTWSLLSQQHQFASFVTVENIRKPGPSLVLGALLVGGPSKTEPTARRLVAILVPPVCTVLNLEPHHFLSSVGTVQRERLVPRWPLGTRMRATRVRQENTTPESARMKVKVA